MAFRYSTGCFKALLGESGVDAGANGIRGIFKDGVIDIYTGAQPASPNDAPTGTKVARVTVNAGAFTHGVATNGLEFDAPVGGVLSKAAAESWQYSGITAGTAGWFRFKTNASDADGSSTTQARIDGLVGTTSGEMILSNVAIVASSPGTIDVFTITLSN